MKKFTPLQPVHDPRLSLWQSSAFATAHAEEPSSSVSSTPVPAGLSYQRYNHPLVLAATAHARLGGTKSTDLPSSGDGNGKPAVSLIDDAGLERLLHGGDPAKPDPVYLSSLFFERANAKAANDAARVARLDAQVRKYSTADTAGWLTCESNYLYYLAQSGGRLYTTWRGQPAGLQFSVIQYRLPNDAIVGVVGDWGTGQDDSLQMLKALIHDAQSTYGRAPDALIHLGDIYYSGTPKGTPSAPNFRGECQTNFLDVLASVFDSVLKRRIPVFTLPGNHEYYSMGVGYYREVLPTVNATIPAANQPASFFCLRTEDGLWQFLGMDTGYHDSNPANQFNPFDPAPNLEPDEVIWHQDKLQNFKGKTVLLSHHQLYSANAKLNGATTGYPPNFNTFLQSYFSPYFSNVAAWLWGHEHNMVLYQNDLVGLAKGRLIGASSYEETTGEDPYKVNYADVPYLDSTKYRLGAENGYYNHGYAIMNLGRARPSDPISISYFQYPSWAGVRSNPPASGSLVYAESIDTPPAPAGQPIAYGASLTLQMIGYGNLAPISSDHSVHYYPLLSPSNSVVVSFIGSAGQIVDGATVQLQTTEASAGQYNVLGAWSTKALYYSKPGYSQQNWTIRKRDTSVDDVIRYGDAFYLVNQSYAGQWISPFAEAGKIWLTTTKDANVYWIAQAIASGPPVTFGQNVQLQTQVAARWMAVGPETEFTQYYPNLVDGAGVSLQFIGGSGPLVSGAAVQIKTTEAAVGAYNLLGAFSATFCYWYKAGYNQLNWQIWKKDTSVDNVIRKGDLVYLVNRYYAGQWLYPRLDGNVWYLSTTGDAGSYYWRLA